MNRPIGVFDSGLGGLTVAGQILRRLPHERIVYFADTAHVPYGERPLEQIREFALGITTFLVERGVKAVVMACNMSSAVALDAARDMFADILVIGVIEPGSRAAAAAGDEAIGVLATTGTVRSGAYGRAIRRLNPRAVVWEQACPAFVSLVEAGRADTEEAEAAARRCVEPLLLSGVTSLVLGCTHYPFLRRAISQAAPGIRIIDPAEETAAELEKLLAEREALAVHGNPGDDLFFASGDTQSFSRLGSVFLRREIGRVQRVKWGLDLVFVQAERAARKVT